MLGHVVQLELPLYRALHSFKLAYNILVAISSAESGSQHPPPKLQGESYNLIKALVAAVIINPISNCFLCLPLQQSPRIRLPVSPGDVREKAMPKAPTRCHTHTLSTSTILLGVYLEGLGIVN